MHVEDFEQLSNLSGVARNNLSMESMAKVIEACCTFPAIEKMKLFQRTIFNFFIGNQNMHLKQFSIITQNDKIELTPAYGLLNTTIAFDKPDDEISLPIMGKKKDLNRQIMIDYFAKEVMGLTDRTIQSVLAQIQSSIPVCKELIYGSFLSNKMKVKYSKLLNARLQVIFP